MLKKMPFLSAAENRESFFKRISRIYPATDPRYRIIERAYNDAKKAFEKKNRESGERYFEHLRAVALILIVYLRVRDPHVIAAALLHDIVEDMPDWPIQRLIKEYGDDIAGLVDWVTKMPVNDFSSKEERDRLYNERLASAPRRAILIKLADRLHNIIMLWACPPAKQEKKRRETIRYYLPLAEREIILIHELEEALELKSA